MKTKNFHDYLKTRLSDEEIAEIKQEAQLEVDILRSIHKILTDTMPKRMKKNRTEKSIMTKKAESTFERFIESLSPEERKKFDEEYQELLLSELILAAMAKDMASVRKLGKMAGLSPSIIQEICNSIK